MSKGPEDTPSGDQMALDFLLSLMADAAPVVLAEAVDDDMIAAWSFVAEWPAGHVYDTGQARMSVDWTHGRTDRIAPERVLLALMAGDRPTNFSIAFGEGCHGAVAGAIVAQPPDKIDFLLARHIELALMVNPVALRNSGGKPTNLKRRQFAERVGEDADAITLSAVADALASPRVVAGQDGAAPLRAIQHWNKSGIVFALPPLRESVEGLEPLISPTRRAAILNRVETFLREEIGIGLHSPEAQAPVLPIHTLEAMADPSSPNASVEVGLAHELVTAIAEIAPKNTGWVSVEARLDTKIKRYEASDLRRFANREQLGQLLDTASLTPRQRQVMSLVLEGKSQLEIASELKLSNGAVKSHISTGQKRLRDAAVGA